MNSKRVNQLFLLIISCRLLTEVVLTGLQSLFHYSMGMITNYLVSELIVVIPTLLFVIKQKENPMQLAGFHKLRISTLLMTALAVMLFTPLMTLVNLLSMLFVKNTAAAMSSQMLTVPFIVTFFFVALFAPFCEELVCRGVMLQGYKRSGSVWKSALLSGLIFALIHMNLNQASYAFVMGVAVALLVEASGSLWSAVVFHGLINGSQVFNMYLVNRIAPQSYSIAQSARMDLKTMLTMITVYLFITAVTLPLAWAVLVWIGKNEHREGVLGNVWKNRTQKKDKMITISFVIALILCITYMLATALIRI